MQKRTAINAVFVGDAQVGKTSLIYTISNGVFPDASQARSGKNTVFFMQSADSPAMLIRDTPSDVSVAADTSLSEYLRSADVVVLVAERFNLASLQRVTQHWYALLNQLGVRAPVLVALNKDEAALSQLPAEVMSHIDTAIEEIRRDSHTEMVVQCSAAELRHNDLVAHIEAAAQYPVSPLLNRATRMLQPSFARALKRVFFLSDSDSDDRIDLHELQVLHDRIYGAQCDLQTATALVHSLAVENDQCVEGGKLTFLGLLYLMRQFLLQGDAQNVWTMLRVFGYNARLELDAAGIPDLPACDDTEVLQLQPHVYAWLTALFLRNADRTLAQVPPSDGRLPPEQYSMTRARLVDLFKIAPQIPFADDYADTVESRNGELTLRGWLSLWASLAHDEPALCMRFLVFFGFFFGQHEDLVKAQKNADEAARQADETLKRDALRLARDIEARAKLPPFAARRFAGGHPSQRNFLRALVVGEAGSGKTTLMRRLIGLPPLQVYHHSEEEHFVTKCVWSGELDDELDDVAARAPVFMQLQEVLCEEDYRQKVLQDDLDDTDLVLLAFDLSDAHSFEYVLRWLQEEIPDSVPVIMMATKSDQGEATQLDSEENDQPIDTVLVAADYNLTVPEISSAFEDNRTFAERAAMLVQVAQTPEDFRPDFGEDASTQTMRTIKTIVKRGITLTLLGGLVFASYYLITQRLLAKGKKNNNSSSSNRTPAVTAISSVSSPATATSSLAAAPAAASSMPPAASHATSMAPQ